MEQGNWLVVIAAAGGLFALGCVWLSLRVARLQERVRFLRKEAEDKVQLAELLSLAQKKIAGLEAHKEALAHAQDTMKTEFRNTANQLFEEVSQKFTVQSEKKIGDILLPLSQRIGEFQKNVDEKFGIAGKENHTLKAEIARIVTMNEQMRLQAENLTKALRGDVKAQGNWGEVILERILEESGLQEGIGYTLQGKEMGLKDAHGNPLKPDVVVHLPDNKHIIIDSKVSLTAYERYCGEQEDAQKLSHLKEFLQSIRNHVAGLSGKNYAAHDKLLSPDFVLLFMPIEGAYSLALQQDSALHAHAWAQKIVIVCPSTLFATLRTIASLWNIEQQNRNVKEIARQAGALYDKFVGLLDDLQKVGRQMNLAQTGYDAAMNKLSTGTGNLISRVENLKTLGAKASKSLPKELIHDNVSALHDEEAL